MQTLTICQPWQLRKGDRIMFDLRMRSQLGNWALLRVEAIVYSAVLVLETTNSKTPSDKDSNGV
jgi:hypothetical protein